jgi:hypothetical protein
MSRRPFNARKVRIPGQQPFDSELEYNGFLIAKAEEAGDNWPAVEREPEFVLIPNQVRSDGVKERACVYKADLRLTLLLRPIAGTKGFMQQVIEFKSPFTAKRPEYVLRRKMVLFFHKITVLEFMTLEDFRKHLESIRYAH